MADTKPGRPGVSDADWHFIGRALELGRRGWGRVHPNPLVGCVLVREGEVVGEGWHSDFGAPHAEVDALAASGESARGATAYVGLEPCRHHGKTPPCTAALIDAGIIRVVFGAEDPGAKSGGGKLELAEAGLEVSGPILTKKEARRENPAFFHTASERPWTALKLGISLDGKIASGPGERTAVSGPEALEEAHRLRAGFDALMVGGRTALVDDPLLTARGGIEPRTPPARVILDAQGALPEDAKILREGGGLVRLVTGALSSADWKAVMRERGAGVLEVASDGEGRLILSEVVARLRIEGVTSLLCEGGGQLASALLSESLVDRLYLIQAPRFLGPKGVPAFPSVQGAGAWELIEEPRRLGGDLWMILEPEEV